MTTAEIVAALLIISFPGVCITAEAISAGAVRKYPLGIRRGVTLLSGTLKARSAARWSTDSNLALPVWHMPVLISQEIQDLLCLFAGWLSFAFHPSFKRLGWNPYALGNFGKMLIDDFPVVSESAELFFGRLHGQR